MAFLPHVSEIIDEIGKVLRKQKNYFRIVLKNFANSFIPKRDIQSFNPIQLFKGIYTIVAVFIGEMGRSIKTWLSEPLVWSVVLKTSPISYHDKSSNYHVN